VALIDVGIVVLVPACLLTPGTCLLSDIARTHEWDPYGTLPKRLSDFCPVTGTQAMLPCFDD